MGHRGRWSSASSRHPAIYLALVVCMAPLAPGSSLSEFHPDRRARLQGKAGEGGIAAFRIPGFVSLEAVSDVLIVLAEAWLSHRVCPLCMLRRMDSSTACAMRNARLAQIVDGTGS